MTRTQTHQTCGEKRNHLPGSHGKTRIMARRKESTDEKSDSTEIQSEFLAETSSDEPEEVLVDAPDNHPMIQRDAREPDAVSFDGNFAVVICSGRDSIQKRKKPA